MFKWTAGELREKSLGETFERGGLETGRRAGSGLRELVSVVKLLAIIQVVPNVGQDRIRHLISSKLEPKTEKGEMDTFL